MPDSAFIDALIGTPSKTPQEIQNAIADARKLGYSDADILKGAQANFGVDVSSYLKPSTLASNTGSIDPSFTPIYASYYDQSGERPELKFDTNTIQGYSKRTPDGQIAIYDTNGNFIKNQGSTSDAMLSNLGQLAKGVAPMALAAIGANLLGGVGGAGTESLYANIPDYLGGGAGTTLADIAAGTTAAGSFTAEQIAAKAAADAAAQAALEGSYSAANAVTGMTAAELAAAEAAEKDASLAASAAATSAAPMPVSTLPAV